MRISEQIKPILAKRKLSVPEVAHQAGYSPQYIYGLLNGDRRWNEEAINKLCTILQLEFKFCERQEDTDAHNIQ